MSIYTILKSKTLKIINIRKIWHEIAGCDFSLTFYCDWEQVM